MKYKEQAKIVSDLRELADFYERPEAIELPTPYITELFYISKDHWGFTWNEEEQKNTWGRIPRLEKSKEKFKRIVRVLGECTKDWQDENLRVVKKIGSIKLTFQVDREAVCTKKPTGNKIIHAATTQYIPERIEEEFEWICEEVSLLAD